jgi:hypothetical protein
MTMLHTNKSPALIQEKINTNDDKEFTLSEIKTAVANMNEKKAPGEEGIPSEIYKSLAENLPRYIKAIYNGCLKESKFPKRWKTALILPIIKPAKEGSQEVNKFRPISLLDIGGEVLEKVLINRINHHVYSNGYMNENQYEFRPQKCTIDIDMEIKIFLQQSLARGKVIAIVSLYVEEAFDAAWWTGIFK